MKRLFYSHLLNWKKSKDRKPLLIVGARRVGKTYLLNEFGKNEYVHCVYINFETDEILTKMFENISLDPKTIIDTIEKIKLTKIIANDTLIIFDEIQACPRALTSLKYFMEQGPEYHVIASGSLLGVSYNRGNVSFPVGIEQRQLYPMTFLEFLHAINQETLINDIVKSYNTNCPINIALHEILLEYLWQYISTGGFPECVLHFLNKQYNLIRDKQSQIIEQYLNDMSKYNTPINANKSRLIYKNISLQLNRDNKKFKFNCLNKDGRKRDYELSLNWLCQTGLVYQVFNVDKITNYTLYNSTNDFKLYVNDVGLLLSMFNIDWQVFFKMINDNEILKGAIIENYVNNELIAYGYKTSYWTSGGIAEVDFIESINGNIIPIEVKSSDNTKSKSLNRYIELYKPEYSIRLSTKNFGLKNNIKSIPLYAIFCLKA